MTPWSNSPAARRLLSQCVATELQPVRKFDTYAITRDEWHKYEGPLADALTTLRDEAGEAANAIAHETGDLTALDAWCDAPDVTAAIDAAFNAAAVGDMLKAAA